MKECEEMGSQVVSIISYFSNINGFMQEMRKNYSDTYSSLPFKLTS